MPNPAEKRREPRQPRDRAYANRQHPEAAKVKRRRPETENLSLRDRMGLAGAATAKLGEFWPEDLSRG